MEQPFFFCNGCHQLFGVMHLPANQAPRAGVVLCHAFGEEKLWSHRVILNFARALSDTGIAAFRFDFMGHGDSAGNSEDSTLDTYLKDIEAATTEIRKIVPNGSPIILGGLRLGATLICEYGARGNSFDGMILWQPVSNGKSYLQELLRINLTTQLAAFGKILQDRKTLVRLMQQGTPANVDGYLISYEFYQGLSKIVLPDLASSLPSLPCCVVQLSPSLKQPHNPQYLDMVGQIRGADFLKLESPPFWKEIKHFCSRPTQLIKSSVDWLEDWIGNYG